jgi:ribosome-associated toxin RatA of RatAB toxin-antitoxin module
MPGASRTVVFNAPIEKVFEVITDYDHYPEFLTEVKKTKQVDRKGNEVSIQYEVDLMKTIKYTVRMREEKPTKLSWSFVEGEWMKDNKGSWLLEAQGPNQTKATYTVEVALGPLVPKTVVNTLVDSSLPKMLDSFKKRIESR